MRLHVVAHPYLECTHEYGLCGFTQKTIRFCWMMKSLGYEVHLYAGGKRTDAVCDSFVGLTDKKDMEELIGYSNYVHPKWDPKHRVWRKYNHDLVQAIKKRGEPGDIVCVLGGNIYRELQDGLPEMKTVEYGIGYYGFALKWKIWESSAWKALMRCSGHPEEKTIRDDDPIIHSFFDEDSFPLGRNQGYLLYVGRVVENKGVRDACEAAKIAGRKMVVIGTGNKGIPRSCGAQYLGEVSIKERNALYAGADAVICPTRKVEAFGNISPEAQMCGTRVISTDVGGFKETVMDGITGWRVEGGEGVVGRIVKAISMLNLLEGREKIRQLAIDRFSVRNQRHKYDAYFKWLAQQG